MVAETHLLGRREERSQKAELKFLHLRLRPQVLMKLQSGFQDKELLDTSLLSHQLYCLVAKIPHLRSHPMLEKLQKRVFKPERNINQISEVRPTNCCVSLWNGARDLRGHRGF